MEEHEDGSGLYAQSSADEVGWISYGFHLYG
jgi:hypothetical protein